MTAPRHASGAAVAAERRDETPQGEAGRRRRLAVIGSVLVLAVAGGLAGGLAGRKGPATALQSPSVAAQAAPVGSQSSSWFCAGSPGPSGTLSQSRVLLVNAGVQAVGARVDVVDTKGKNKSEEVQIPADGQLAVAPGSLLDGSWLATRVDVDGGGVSATELVDGSAGWASAPCASETAPKWYFAGGATATGNTLRMSVFNPTANLAVVDLSFVTASGLTQPQPFQGLVLEPGAFRSVTVGQYVQDQKQVAATVTARSGTVVATELQSVHSGGISGIALRLGSPVLSDAWYLPRAQDTSGGTSEVTVYNPSAKTETVSVRARPSSGKVAPFVDKLGPGSVWTLDTAEEVRIPDAVDYSTTVRVTGGPGVVVDRSAAVAGGTASPGWGDDAFVPSAATQATRWVLPAVAGPGSSVSTATAPAPALVLQNPGRRPVAALVSSLTSSGVHRLARVRVAGDAFVTLAAGSDPLLVTAAGPLAVVGDVSAATAPATALVPAIPQG